MDIPPNGFYRPLYDSECLPPAGFIVRPLAMFLETVEKDGVRVPRFERIQKPL